MHFWQESSSWSKGRGEILTRNIDFKLKKLPALIYACFVLHDICETKYFSTNGTPVILQTNCHITEIMNPYLFYQSRGRLDHNRCAGKICKLSCNTKKWTCISQDQGNTCCRKQGRVEQ